MSGDTAPPAGPDLAAGIPSDQLVEGRSLAGRVGDDAVLLARSGGRCFAIGATCSHYGGPLAEGIIVDGTVRCPWHHAAFHLDTGQPARPPALDPLPCWRVEERGGTVRVIAREDASSSPPPLRRTQAKPDALLIVGAGAAGIEAAVTLRREGYHGRLTMVDADPDAPVDRPNLSKDYLAGTAEEAWVTLRAPSFFTDNDIHFERERRVAELDVRARRVRLDDGRDIGFDALLLATGASPIRLPLPNEARLPLFTLRTLADSRAIIRAAEESAGAPVVVLGASFIGLEVAASLRTRGLEVHVVAPETHPLERVLGPELGALVHRVHMDHGVIFHLGQKPRELVKDGVVLESGDRVPAVFVVAGIGVRPNVELGERAGLDVDRGMLVDQELRTSSPAVFAAGDVARYPDARTGEHIRVEHWVAAQRQAQTAAGNMLGAGEHFTAVPFFWSAHYDLSISYVGHAEGWDAIAIDGSLDGRDCEVRYISGGKALAVATIGRDRSNLQAEVVMENETRASLSGAAR